jgi:hypothetical protein
MASMAPVHLKLEPVFESALIAMLVAKAGGQVIITPREMAELNDSNVTLNRVDTPGGGIVLAIARPTADSDMNITSEE